MCLQQAACLDDKPHQTMTTSCLFRRQATSDYDCRLAYNTMVPRPVHLFKHPIDVLDGAGGLTLVQFLV